MSYRLKTVNDLTKYRGRPVKFRYSPGSQWRYGKIEDSPQVKYSHGPGQIINCEVSKNGDEVSITIDARSLAAGLEVRLAGKDEIRGKKWSFDSLPIVKKRAVHAIGSYNELLNQSGKVVRVTSSDCTTPRYAMVSGPVPVPGGMGKVLQWESQRKRGGCDKVTVITPSVFKKYTFHIANKSEVRNKEWSDPINT